MAEFLREHFRYLGCQVLIGSGEREALGSGSRQFLGIRSVMGESVRERTPQTVECARLVVECVRETAE